MENGTRLATLRLADLNDGYRSRLSAAMDDSAAMELLHDISERISIDFEDFDFAANGLALSKLTSAELCGVGEAVVYITDAGNRVLESLTTRSEI